MAINEITVIGRKFRRLIDKEKALWQTISFWHKATDCEFNDGKNAEEKLGAINGITSNINDDSDDICASIKTVNQLSNDLAGVSFVVSDGKIIGYRVDGADTVIPFSSVKVVVFDVTKKGGTEYGQATVSFDITSKYPNYANITKDNIMFQYYPEFYILAKEGNPHAAYSNDMTMSYNASTGIITLSLLSHTFTNDYLQFQGTSYGTNIPTTHKLRVAIFENDTVENLLG